MLAQHGGEIAGCQPLQTHRPRQQIGLRRRKLKLFAVTAYQFPGLLETQKIELDLEIETTQRSLIQTQHQICRGDEYAGE